MAADDVGFYGEQSGNYDEMYQRFDRLEDSSYAKVCLLGNVRVKISEKDFGEVNVGDYVMPAKNGYASLKNANGENHKAGYKVTSKGTIESSGVTAWHYVRVSLVPQNDSINRIVEEVQNAKVELNNVTIQLGEKIEGIEGNIVNVAGKVEGLEGTVENVNNTWEETKQALTTAKQTAQEAKENIATVQREYSEAVTKANDALESVEGALKGVAELQDTIQPLATWAESYECELQQDINMNTRCYFELDGIKYRFTMPANAIKGNKVTYDPKTELITAGGYNAQVEVVEDVTGLTLVEPFKLRGNHSVAGFLAQAAENNTQLASLIQAFGNKGTDIATIIQKIDENGAAIQHIVAHVEKYTLGNVSPIYVADENSELASSVAEFLQPGHIYVPTESHYEGDLFFTQGMYYEWSKKENSEELTWNERGTVYTWTDYDDIIKNFNDDYEHLWYCGSDGVLVGDKLMYSPNTLYRWDSTNNIWVPVALANDNGSTVVGVVDQTTKKLITTYTDLKKNMATIQVEVDKIISQVGDLETGTLSGIEQTADEILAGIYKPGEGATSLDILLNGIVNTSTNIGVILVRHGLDTPPYSIDDKYYKYPPNWNGEKFEFAAANQTEDGAYYFHSEDQTLYCEKVEDDYKIWRIGNVAIASLGSKVSDLESKISSGTEFETPDLNKTITSITQVSDAERAEIASVVLGERKTRTEINLELDLDTKNDISGYKKYTSAPDYTDGEFTFGTRYVDGNGAYCIPNDANGQYYYKLLFNSDGTDIIGYEKYEMDKAHSKFASIVQKTEDDKSYIGLVTGNDEETAGIIVNTINDKSSMLINADKISISGTTTFADILNPADRTTISGNHIKTGVLESNNYEGPRTYIEYGKVIQENEMINLGEDIIFSFVPGVTTYIDPDEQECSLSGQGFIGIDLGVEVDTYYCMYEGNMYQLTISQSEQQSATEATTYILYTYMLDELPIVTDVPIDVYRLESTETFYTIADGEKEDYFYYTLILKGTRYELTSVSDNPTYYEANTMNAGETLSSFTTTAGTSTSSKYVISQQEFELIPKDKETGNYRVDGTKFDLNNGTIYSKNFIIDREGDLTITGEITATGGYIGGFIIDDKALYNGQGSMVGAQNQRGDGVYIGTDGIGLGNGGFVVTSDGTLATAKSVTIYGPKSESNKTLEPKITLDGTTGQVTLKGNIDMNGNMTISGNLLWDAVQNSVCVLYAKSKPSSKPPNKTSSSWQTYSSYPESTSSSTAWHRVLDTNDLYGSYSYDGGETWSAIIKIQGEDGKGNTDGNGGAVSVDAQTIFNIMSKNDSYFKGFVTMKDSSNQDRLYLNADYINTQSLLSVGIRNSLIKSDNTISQTEYIDIHKGRIEWKAENNLTKMQIAYGIDNDDTYVPYMLFGAGGTKSSNNYSVLKETLKTNQGYLVKDIKGLHIAFVNSQDVYQSIDFIDANETTGLKKGVLSINTDTFFDSGGGGIDRITTFGTTVNFDNNVLLRESNATMTINGELKINNILSIDSKAVVDFGGAQINDLKIVFN